MSVAEEDAIARAAEGGAGSAPGALTGLPLVVKDNVHALGFACTAATPALRGFLPPDDAPALARLRAQGMVVVGKTNLHELALGITSTHTAAGVVPNPALPGRVAGGSSGGTAAAVAAGVCAHGIGTDTGGSTRIPAAFTGTWGFRPSTGRYPGSGVVSIAYSRDTIGPMAADLASLRQLDAALAGAPAGASARPATAGGRSAAPLRLGFDPADVERCEAGVAAAVQAALGRLAGGRDVELVEVSFAALDRATAVFEPELGAQELAPSLAAYLRSEEGLPGLDGVLAEMADPHVVRLVEGSLAAVADGVWTPRWHELHNDCARARASYLAVLHRAGLDAVLRPVVPILPPRVDAVLGLDLPERDRLFGVVTGFARLATVTGAPSLSMPLAGDGAVRSRAGLPGGAPQPSGAGLLLDGIPGCDEELLALAARIEDALG